VAAEGGSEQSEHASLPSAAHLYHRVPHRPPERTSGSRDGRGRGRYVPTVEPCRAGRSCIGETGDSVGKR
jgi:hypothetical protein